MAISDERRALIKSRQLALLLICAPGERVGALDGSLERPYNLSGCPCTAGEKVVDNPQCPLIREDVLDRPVDEENLGFTFGYGFRDAQEASLLLDSEDDFSETLTIGDRIEQIRKDYATHERLKLIKSEHARLKRERGETTSLGWEKFLDVGAQISGSLPREANGASSRKDLTGVLVY